MIHKFPHSSLWWAILLAAIWAPVIYLLGAQWSVYEQYSYGWAVPCLCLFLAGQKISSCPPAAAPVWKNPALFFLAAAGLVFWVMRLLQEANPVWRAASLGLALAAVAMTLLVIYLAQGEPRMKHFLFPVAFFLVAVPWPTPIEGLIIQSLTRFNSGLVVEVVNLAGVPALQHGNVIEISAGMVGIDEACSGIRSFQATLMIALFFGEFYGLRRVRRWWLMGIGPALALGFNLARTLVLVLVAAHAGLPAMEKWHDPTGVVLLVGCFLCLWLVSLWLAKKNSSCLAPSPERQTLNPELRTLNPASRRPTPAIPISKLASGLAVWAILVSAFTEAWFRSHEVRNDQMLTWKAQWPDSNATLRTNTIPRNSQQVLHCDESSSANWLDAEGIIWQAFFLRWYQSDTFYGRARVALSIGHNPASCLTGAGMKLRLRLDPIQLSAGAGRNLWFDRYVFTADGRDFFVFFSQTEQMTGKDQLRQRATRLARLKQTLAGSRNFGQNILEVVLAGPESAGSALQIFSKQLPELISDQPGKR